jgi:mannose-6-phosphate isomerase-like protein (cupin superfamily)
VARLKWGIFIIMKTEKEFIDSGILELYVLGCTSAEESKEVELLALSSSKIRTEINAIEQATEIYATAHAIAPNPILKPFLMASIDYSNRIKNGEPVTEPPLLNKQSVIKDYGPWLERSDMTSPPNEPVFAKIIGYTPEAITAIVWIKEYAPQEVHDHEFEKFLIVEGTCNIVVADEVHELVAGDYFAIPLHKNHLVKVTSVIACKVILQRVAA